MTRNSKPSSKTNSAPIGELDPFLRKIGFGAIGIIHFVCPLLFFTNLTRNPYYTQIALLNILIAICGMLWAIDIWRSGQWKLPRVSFEIPLLIFLVVSFISTTLSWLGHEELRIGIQSEGIRIWVFTLVNMCLALYLPFFFMKRLDESDLKISIWTDLSFAIFWGILWMGFRSWPQTRSLIWHPYGAFIWALALIYTWNRVKDGELKGIFHLIFMVSCLAGGYSLLQYMGRDLIWASLVKPYGGRPVSTFGNPNFLSSYLLLVSPLALVFAFQSKGKEMWGYLTVTAISTAAAMCTLTRSTYVGLVVAFVTLFFLLYKRGQIRISKWIFIAVGIFIVAVFIFPNTPVLSRQSPLARFTEIIDAIQEGKVYQAWHQRILIWSCAWDMVVERPFFGKGWGVFELFYPYYQGKHILTELLAPFRTHANNAHNILMEVWAQIGFLGTGVAIWLFATLSWGGFKVVQSKGEGLRQFLPAALLAGLIGMVADNFFGNVSIFFAVPAFLFWWNAGTLFNEAGPVAIKVRPMSRSWEKLFLIFFLIFCLFVIIYFFKRWRQEVNYFQGFKAAKMGQVEESIKFLEKAYDWFPREVNSNYEMGNSYARMAKILSDRNIPAKAKVYKEQAAWAYSEALKANPGYDEIFFNLGVTYSQLGEKEKAKEKLRVAVFINPLLRDAYASLGNIYATEKDFEKTRDVFAAAVLTFPKDKEIWLNLGFAHIKLDEKEKALEAFKAAYRLDIKFTQAWNNLRLVAQELNINEPLVEVPQLIQRTDQLVQQKRFQEALPLARQLANILPDNADARLSYANLLFYNQRVVDAIQEMDKVLEINPRLTAARLNLSDIHRSQGNFDLAKEQLNAILTYDKKNTQAKEALAKLNY